MTALGPKQLAESDGISKRAYKNASSMGSSAILSHSFVMLMVIVIVRPHFSLETFDLNALQVVAPSRNSLLKTGFVKSN